MTSTSLTHETPRVERMTEGLAGGPHGPAYLSLEGSSMHREDGDRTTPEGDHRSGTVPGSHRLRVHAAYLGYGVEPSTATDADKPWISPPRHHRLLASPPALDPPEEVRTHGEVAMAAVCRTGDGGGRDRGRHGRLDNVGRGRSSVGTACLRCRQPTAGGRGSSFCTGDGGRSRNRAVVPGRRRPRSGRRAACPAPRGRGGRGAVSTGVGAARRVLRCRSVRTAPAGRDR